MNSKISKIFDDIHKMVCDYFSNRNMVNNWNYIWFKGATRTILNRVPFKHSGQRPLNRRIREEINR